MTEAYSIIQHIVTPSLNSVLAKRGMKWTSHFGIMLIKLLNERYWASQWALIWKSTSSVFQLSAGPQEWRSSVATGQYSWWRPYKRSASGVSDLWGSEPNTSLPPLSPCLDDCAHCTMSRRVCDFNVWVGSRQKTLPAACWTVRESTSIIEELFEKSPV